MSEEIDKIIFNAKLISGGRSLGDNEPIKIFELETIEKNITKVTSNVALSNKQKESLQSLFDSISKLKTLSGDSFRYQAMGFGNRVELFFNDLE